MDWRRRGSDPDVVQMPTAHLPHHACGRPPLDVNWKAPHWSPAITIDHFRPETGTLRPHTQLKLCWSDHGLSGLFQVDEAHVRCVHTGYQQPVYKDSCVEIFLQPKAGLGYFNFEFNAGGALLASYVTDPVRTPDGGLRSYTLLDQHQCAQVEVATTLPSLIDPPIQGPVRWWLGFYIPFGLLTEFIGMLEPQEGDRWRGNFYKCGDETPHPHWASWAPVPELNFHRPDCFGNLLL